MRSSSMLLTAAALLLCSSGIDGQWGPKPKFGGTWQLSPEKSEMKAWKPAALVLTIAQPIQGEIHVIEVAKGDGSDRKVEFKCSTAGKECDAGEKSAKLMMYYNGPNLVSIERIGKDGDTVLKRIYSLSEDGNTMTLEISQIVPPRAEVDKLVFTKQVEASGAEPQAASPPTQ